MKLTVTDLGKQYRRDFWGLKEFSLEVGPGILGLLGPNGAGKSTFMRMLATITKPTDGKILWNDVDIVKSPDTLRAVLGYLPQDFGVYPNLNAVEFLEYMAAIKGLDATSTKKRIDELLQVVNLLSDLSGERIVILSTHIVSDVEATATHIVLINKGQLLRESAPEDLLKELDGKVWEWTVKSDDLPALKQKHIVSGTIRRTDGVQVRVVSESKPEANAQNISPNLEDAYLYFIGGHA